MHYFISTRHWKIYDSFDDFSKGANYYKIMQREWPDSNQPLLPKRAKSVVRIVWGQSKGLPILSLYQNRGLGTAPACRVVEGCETLHRTEESR